MSHNELRKEERADKCAGDKYGDTRSQLAIITQFPDIMLGREEILGIDLPNIAIIDKLRE